MNDIVFHHVCKKYGSKTVLQDLDFKIHQGERLVILGPSGCGKSTLLRLLAGFEDISGGTVEMGGVVVNELPPGKRNIAMVFQSYALFPHMNVRDNIIFGLHIQKLPQDEINRRATQAINMLQLNGYETAMPRALSGGQKQRVALGRAIVKQSPYFLLDEPLSNLDAQLRQQARLDLVRIHELYKSTMLYVTHDQVEAMTVAQRIIVLHKGSVQQLGTPHDIYFSPANTFVASFVGSPSMNLIHANIEGQVFAIGSAKVPVPTCLQPYMEGRKDIIIGIRPEHIQCTGDAANSIAAKHMYTENTGNMQTSLVQLPTGEKIFVQYPVSQTIIPDWENIYFNWQYVCLFDSDTKKNLLIQGGQS